MTVKTIDRECAKQMLAERQLRLLSNLNKRNILEKYWWYESEGDIRDATEEGEFPLINESVRELIVSTDLPPDVLPAGIEPILLDWLIFKLDKTLNVYLSRKLNEFGVVCEVQGEVEEAGLCPCCRYYSIGAGEAGLWDVCPVCFWENGGDGPNHLSLSEARQNFLTIGAMSERHLKDVDPEGPAKFAKQSGFGMPSATS